MFSSGDQTFREPKEGFLEILHREMGTIVFHYQSALRFSTSTAVSKIHLRGQNLSRKEIAVGALVFAFPNDLVRPLVLSIQADGDRRGISSISKGRISALGRLPKDRGNKAEHSSGSKSPKNQEEIISIIRRIRSSIAKESAKLKERSSKSSDENASLESVLEVLPQSSTPGKPARREGNKTLPRRRDSSRKESKAELSSPSTRPPSNFVKKSTIPSLDEQQESAKQKSLSLPATSDVKRHEFLEQIDAAIQEIEKMKLLQLKEIAKSKGIKGYSRMKKAELVQLLSPSNKL